MSRCLALVFFTAVALANLLAAGQTTQPTGEPTNEPATTSPSTASDPSTDYLLSVRQGLVRTESLTDYVEKPGLTGQVRSGGGAVSSILAGYWANEFRKIYPNVKIAITFGGKSVGFEQLMAGDVDLVPAARPMSEAEVKTFKAKFGYEPLEIPVAVDAVAIYTNRYTPLESVSLSDLDRMYSRAPRQAANGIYTWGELGIGGPQATHLIHLYSLSAVHSTNQAFKESVLGGEDYRFNVEFQRVPNLLVGAISADRDGIGFMSIMFATKAMRVVPIRTEAGELVLPTYQAALDGEYPLARKQYLVCRKPSDEKMTAAALEFIRFALSRAGQRVLVLRGGYPLDVIQQRKSLAVLNGK
jgi:phosphate transport system substrate-binding protein